MSNKSLEQHQPYELELHHGRKGMHHVTAGEELNSGIMAGIQDAHDVLEGSLTGRKSDVDGGYGWVVIIACYAIT
jgi:hypothetical protein